MTTPTRGRRASGTGAVLLSLSGLSGCIQDDMCSAGEQPLYEINHPDGGVCIADGAAVPEGFAKYPERRVPQKVGDEYDRWPRAEDYPWPDEVNKP